LRKEPDIERAVFASKDPTKILFIMKTKQLIIAITILLLGFVAGLYLSPDSSESVSTTMDVVAPAKATIWTCSMHPLIQQPNSGDCPICGMDLIPLINDSGADDGPRTLSMSDSSRALADIQTTLVQQEYPVAEVRLVGQLDYDETLEKSLTARFPARIDELFVNFTGIPVKAGEHLAKVYSPDLLLAQRELLTAYRADPDGSITGVAKEKLRLWDLLPVQIDEIIERNEAKDHFVLKAPIGGVVVAKNVKEGDYVKTGEVLFRIVDLSNLWAELDAYESDLPWLRYGQDVVFSVEGVPGETFHGQISFIEPEVNRKTRTVAVRVNVPNPDGRLKPGMFVRSIVSARLAAGGKVYAPEFAGKWISPMHPEVVKDGPGQCDVCGMDLVPAESLGYVDHVSEPAPVIVPSSAVLQTGKRAVVYVEKPNAERPTYDGREIVLGPRAGDNYIVISGLESGDRVVTNGAFKIDSALQIQAKPSMMNPSGGGQNPGHNHGGEAPKSGQVDHSQHKGMTMLEISDELAPKLLSPYLAMQSALASDALDTAKAQAKDMMKVMGHSGALPELLHNMLAAATLEAFRKPYFETLSNTMIAAVKANPDAFAGGLYLMHCPMVYEDRGADWLQSDQKLMNPYYGSMMLHCGELKEAINSL
jgi:Cu(I)/Ag(I) efflux system membrane fusion protein